jgi:NAD(P)-dependent dehydrogenase (short-subunit alcohol dehydrogenase family)
MVVVNDLGCTVDGSGSSPSMADAVVDEIRAAGGRAIASAASVATEEGGASIVEAAVREYGRVDAVVLNAGILANAPFHEMPGRLIGEVIATNLQGAIAVAQPAYRLMRRQNYGRLVFTSSGAGLFGGRNAANYAAAKAGMIGLSSTIGIEGAEFGIKSNIVVPGAETRMAAAIRPEDIGEEILQRFAARPPPPGATDPAFVTPMVVYLASEACTVSQQMFSVARGRFARAFVGVGTGWYGPRGNPASPEEIARNLPEISDIAQFSVPTSVYEEMAMLAADAPVEGG